MSVTELAGVMGVAQSVVSGWRTDRRGLPETPTLFKLAKALSCTIEDLLKDIDEEYHRLRYLRSLEMLGKSSSACKLLERVECGIEDGFIVLSDVEQVFYPRLITLPKQLMELSNEEHGPGPTAFMEIGLSTPDDDMLARAIELSIELLVRLNARLPYNYDPDASVTAAERPSRAEHDELNRALEWLRRSGSTHITARSIKSDRERLAAEKGMPSSERKAVELVLNTYAMGLRRRKEKSLNHG